MRASARAAARRGEASHAEGRADEELPASIHGAWIIAAAGKAFKDMGAHAGFQTDFTGRGALTAPELSAQLTRFRTSARVTGSPLPGGSQARPRVALKPLHGPGDELDILRRPRGYPAS